MTIIRAGDAEFNITPSIGAASGSAPQQPITSFGSTAGKMDLSLQGASIQMVVLGGSPEASFIDELASDIWLLGDLPMRYRIWAVWQDFDVHKDDRISMQAVTYERLMNRRYIGAGGLTYANTDVGTILWGAIQHTQAKAGGDLGITAGDITTGILTSVDWLPGDNIGARIEEVMKATGCYWTIDHNLVLDVHVRADTVPLLEPIMWGVNAAHLQRASAGAGFANSVFMSGGPQVTPLFETDPGVGTDPRGLWEAATARPGETIQAALDLAAAGELALRSQALSHWNVTYVTEHWIGASRVKPGDRATLVVPPTLAGPITPPSQVAVECESMAVAFDGDGGFEVKCVFNELPE